LYPSNLQPLLRDGKLVLAVIGLGRIGLPLAVTFAQRGATVISVDKDPKLLQKIRDGRSPFYEPGLDEALTSIGSEKMRVTSSVQETVREAGIIIVCVSASSSKPNARNLGDLIPVCREIAEHLQRDQLVVIRSTVPPGTTRNMIAKVLGKASGLNAGKDFHLAFCPERLSEGHALAELVSIPHIVGGIDAQSVNAAEALFQFLGGEVVRANTIEEAEFAKICDNVYRQTNIALANELALIFDKSGVDMVRTIALANTSPRTKIFHPGISGGRCLINDPQILARMIDPPSIIANTRRANDRVIAHMLRLIDSALGEVGKRTADSRIAVLGLAFKAGTDDLRKSPAKPLIEKLIKRHVSVRAHDPFVTEKSAKTNFPKIRTSNSVLEAVRGADCIVIATDHPQFETLDLAALARVARMPAAFVDGRCQFDPEHVKDAGFVYRGIGRIS
jgi:UDP-N-acetyl-D-mannosaminuronic acid dehydrogenase